MSSSIALLAFPVCWARLDEEESMRGFNFIIFISFGVFCPLSTLLSFFFSSHLDKQNSSLLSPAPLSRQGLDPFPPLSLSLSPHRLVLFIRHPGHHRQLHPQQDTHQGLTRHKTEARHNTSFFFIFAMYTSENIKRRNPVGSSFSRDQGHQQQQDDHHYNSQNENQNRASADPYGPNPLKPAFQQQQHQQQHQSSAAAYGYRDHYQFGYAPPRKEYSANKVYFCFVLLPWRYVFEGAAG
jgi:hypothetical protein